MLKIELASSELKGSSREWPHTAHISSRAIGAISWPRKKGAKFLAC